MEFNQLVLVVVVVVVFGVLFVFLRLFMKKKLNLLFSLKGRMFIIGYLYLMDDNEVVYWMFVRISEQNGFLMMIYMGNKFIFLVSIVVMVEQVFKYNDQVFVFCFFIIVGKILGFDFKSIVFVFFGNYYRCFCCIYIVELFFFKCVVFFQVQIFVEFI